MSRRFLALGLVVAMAAVGLVVLLRSHRSPAPGRNVIVVGLDGADWQLLDRYVADGAMPELARLQREGRPGVLKSLVPALSPLVWTTIATGRSPLEHKILDFTRFHPVTGTREPITSDERRVKAVWEMVSEQGRDVAVFGLWATHPAEPVRGLMVSDRLFSFQRTETSAPAHVVHPEAESARIMALRSRVDGEVGLSALQAYLPWLTAAELDELTRRGNPYAHPATALRRVLVETRLYHHIASHWIRERKPALAFVYFQGTDSIGHVFAPYAPPRQPSIDPADFERYSAVPGAYFREVDRLLGEYRALAEASGAALLLVSDHGFLWSEGRPPRPDSLARATAGLWHRQEGIYLLWGRGVEPAPRGEAQVGQVTATLLALLGLPRAKGVEGPALAQVAESALELDYGPRRNVTVAGAETGGAAGEEIEKLRALGYVGATESATRATGKGTRTAGSYNNEGVLLREAGRRDAARAAFEEALRVDPHAASAAHNLSVLLNDAGEKERADVLLLQALADGLGDGTRIVLSAAMAFQQGGDAERASRLVDGAIERKPDDPHLRMVRGRALLEAKDCAAALQDLQVVRRQLPLMPIAHGLAGTALLCLGRTTEGRAALEESLRLDPSQARLREALGRLD
jgi:Flp pilus assembly protein TadD